MNCQGQFQREKSKRYARQRYLLESHQNVLLNKSARFVPIDIHKGLDILMGHSKAGLRH